MVILLLPHCMKIRKTNRWISLALWLAASLLAVTYLANRLHVVSDISQFMPDYGVKDQKLALLLDELQQGQTSKLLFVRLRAESPGKSANLSNAVKRSLLTSGLFDSVVNGQFDIEISDFKQLYRYRYLLNDDGNIQEFTTSRLRSALTERLNEIRSGMGMLVKQTLASDPTNSFITYIQNIKQTGNPEKHLGVWFTPDKRSSLLIAGIEQEGFDLDRQQMAINFIQKSVVELGNGQATLDISGPGTFAVATRQKIQQTLTTLSVVGCGLILCILLLSYRSVPLVILVGIPLFSAVMVAMVVTNAAFGSIHGITLAFGITLLGVCLDYPVHLFSHLRENQPACVTLRTIWPTLRLGVLTTSLGYLVLFWSGFAGLSQLALFAVTGLGTALAVTRWVVPGWVPEHYRPKISEGRLLNILEKGWHFRYGVWLVLITGSVALGSLLWRGASIWEQDISALSPISEQSRLLDRELRQQLGAPDVNHVFIITSDNLETVLQETEHLTSSLQPLFDAGLASQAFSVTNLLPSQASQRERQTRLPRREDLETSLNLAVEGLPFKTGLFDEFIQDVESSRLLQPLSVEDMLASPLARLISSNLFERRGQWISIIRLAGVQDEVALSHWLQQYPDVAQAYVNLHHTTSSLIDQYRVDAITWLLIGSFVMALVLLLFTRSAVTTLRLLLAPVLAVAVSLGVQVVIGERLNLFHVLSVLLVVGIGVDYSLFFNRTVSNIQEWRQSLHGVVVSASSTLAVFSILVFSGIPVMVAIGQTVAIGVLVCFVFALLLAKKQDSINP